MPTGPSPHRFSLLTDSSFVVYYGASIVSFLGMQVGRVVLPLLCYQLSDSAALTALLFTVQLLPGFLLGLFAGALADRVSRRALMIGGYLAAGLGLAIAPLLAWVGSLTVGGLYLAAVVSAAAYTVAEAADMGAVPALVGRDRIVAASSLVHGAWTLCGVIGLPLGGALAAAVGAVPALALNAATFMILAALLPFVRRPLGPRLDDARRQVTFGGILRDIGEGFKFIRTHPVQWPLLLVGTLGSVATGAGLSLVVVYAVRHLGFDQDGGFVGLLYAGGAVGALLAASLLPTATRLVPPGQVSIGAQSASAILLAAAAVVTWAPASIALLGVWEFAVTLAVLNSISIRQRITPDALQSRVNASVRLVGGTAQAIGAALGGLLADVTTVGTTYLLIAALAGTGAVAAWLSPIRRIDHAALARAMAVAEEWGPTERETALGPTDA